MKPPADFGEIDAGKLAALIFELAAQLHIERTRRLALETALQDSGVLLPTQIEAASNTAPFKKSVAEAADAAVLKLLRVLKEPPDPRAPLRCEAPSQDGGNS